MFAPDGDASGRPDRDPGGRVEVDPLEVHADERGLVFEPVDGGELPGFRNLHVALTEPGEVRGNHVHREKDEVLAVEGPALVRWSEGGERHEHAVPGGSVHRFRFPAGVAHAVRFGGEGRRLLAALATAPFDPDDPDVERVVLIGDGPEGPGAA